MAYITPDTTVYLLRDIKVDPAYANTIYFANATAQYTYFVSKYKHQLTAQTYQRIEKNVIRVQKTEAEVMDCNYMMFRNTAYKDKWFYAFITGTEYVNDVTTNIYYQLDVVQSWLFEMTLQPCMIDRTHIPTIEDTVGANITPEPVNLGEYVHSNQEVLVNLHDRVVCIQAIEEQSFTPYDFLRGGIYDGVYSGCKIWFQRIHQDASYYADLESITRHLNLFRKNPDNILGMYMLPAYCLHSEDANVDNGYISDSYTENTKVVNSRICNGNETFGTYTPKNKKMYTYPYNYQEILTNDGQTMKLRYEFFPDKRAKVAINTSIATPVQVVARPYDYKGIAKPSGSGASSNYIYADYEEHINLTNFPLCSWNNDYFSTWVSQNGLPMALGIASTVGGMWAMQNHYTESHLTDAGKVTQSKIGHFMQLDPRNPKHQKWFDQPSEPVYSNDEIFMSGLPNITQALQGIYEASIHADNFRGTLNTANADYGTNSMNLYHRRTHITAEYAKMIDEFFELYGYNVGEIRTVDRNVRPYWTYVKTKDCVITGRCPMSAIKFVESLYDRGIRWWSNGDNIGNYLNLNNH